MSKDQNTCGPCHFLCSASLVAPGQKCVRHRHTLTTWFPKIPSGSFQGSHQVYHLTDPQPPGFSPSHAIASISWYLCLTFIPSRFCAPYPISELSDTWYISPFKKKKKCVIFFTILCEFLLSTWISHMYTYRPSLWNLPSPPNSTPLGHHGAVSWASCAVELVPTS